MSSPFPGMDPYLEDASVWPVFHHELVACLHQTLLPLLKDRYAARTAQRDYKVEDANSPAGEQQRHKEEFIEICERADGRLITLIDVVSPANKQTDSGRRAYLETRREGQERRANLVEIDLVLQGQPTLEYSREGLPEWDYAVTVTRATQPARFEIYTAALPMRPPRFRLPLASDDRDTVLDLAKAVAHAFDQGGFASRIDYQRDPPTAVSPRHEPWLRELLGPLRRHQGHAPREPGPTFLEHSFAHDDIAVVAYRLWELDGRRHGKDKDYWYRAITQLQREAQNPQHENE